MAYSTGVSLLGVNSVTPVFTLTLSTNSITSSAAGSPVFTDVNTTVVIDAAWGTLSNITYNFSLTEESGTSTLTHSFLNSVTSLTNTVRSTLTGGSLAWKYGTLTITATSSLGYTRSQNITLRMACNYTVAIPTYSNTSLSGDSEIKVITTTDPFIGTLSDNNQNILIRKVNLSESNMGDFFVSSNTPTTATSVQADDDGVTDVSHYLLPSASHSGSNFVDYYRWKYRDSWGLYGAFSATEYAVIANRVFFPTVASSYTRTNKNGMRLRFQPDGDCQFTENGTTPQQGSFVSATSWITNDRIDDICTAYTLTGDKFFPTTTPYYRIKVEHLSGNTSWTFSRASGSASTALNKSQWYEMLYNSSYPDYVIHLTSNDVNGTYTCQFRVTLEKYDLGLWINTTTKDITFTLTDA